MGCTSSSAPDGDVGEKIFAIQRKLIAAVILLALGAGLAGVGIYNAVHSVRNGHSFSHGTHVSASVDSVKRVKGKYVEIVLTYPAGNADISSKVQDPNAIDQELHVGGKVDAVFLSGEPSKVAVSGEYDNGFQGVSIIMAVGGFIAFGVGVFSASLGLRGIRQAKSHGVGRR